MNITHKKIHLELDEKYVCDNLYCISSKVVVPSCVETYSNKILNNIKIDEVFRLPER